MSAPKSFEEEDIAVRRLAGAVILQAVKDAVGRGLKNYETYKRVDKIQWDARKFFRDSEELHTWAAIAGTSAETIMRLYNKLSHRNPIVNYKERSIRI